MLISSLLCFLGNLRTPTTWYPTSHLDVGHQVVGVQGVPRFVVKDTSEEPMSWSTQHASGAAPPEILLNAVNLGLVQGCRVFWLSDLGFRFRV